MRVIVILWTCLLSR